MAEKIKIKGEFTHEENSVWKCSEEMYVLWKGVFFRFSGDKLHLYGPWSLVCSRYILSPGSMWKIKFATEFESLQVGKQFIKILYLEILLR